MTLDDNIYHNTYDLLLLAVLAQQVDESQLSNVDLTGLELELMATVAESRAGDLVAWTASQLEH